MTAFTSEIYNPFLTASFGGIKGVTVFDPIELGRQAAPIPITTQSLIAQTDKEEFRLSPIETDSNTTTFTLTSLDNQIRPVANLPGLSGNFSLYYRVDTTAFWEKAKNNVIPTKDLPESIQLHLKWLNNKQAYLSKIRLIRSNAGKNTSVVLLSGLILLLVLITIFRKNIHSLFNSGSQKSYNEPAIIEEEKDIANEGEHEVTDNTIPEDPPVTHDPLQKFLDELEEKEEKIFSYPKNISSQFLSDLQDILETEIEQPDFSVEYVAELLHLSARHFHRKVVEFTGTTPNKVITFHKLKRAKVLVIENLDIRALELANKLGYKNASYFSRSFKSQYGMTPSQLSQRIKELAVNKTSGDNT